MKIRKFIFDENYYHRPGILRGFLKAVSKKQRINFNKFLQCIADGSFQYERVDCLCGNDEFDVLTSVERHKLPQFMCICTRCGLVHNNPRLDQRSYAYYYESGIYRGHAGETVADVYPPDTTESHYPKIVAFLNANDPAPGTRKRAFEIGCNTGYNLFNFKKNGWDVGGIEPFQAACDEANRFGLNVTCGQIEHHQGSNDYDLVFFSEVFEHLMDPVSALKAVHSVLKPDGILYIGHIGLLHEGWKNIYKFAQVGHPYNHSLATLKMVVEAQGYELIAGDEGINAIFHRAKTEARAYECDPNAYAAIVDKFTSIEQEYKTAKGWLREAKTLLIELLVKLNLLEPTLGLVGFVRSLAKRIGGITAGGA